MFISKDEKDALQQSINSLNMRLGGLSDEVKNDIDFKINAWAAELGRTNEFMNALSETLAKVVEDTESLRRAVNYLQSKATKNVISPVAHDDTEVEILKKQLVIAKEQLKSVNGKFASLRERYEEETKKPLITRDRMSRRQREAEQLIKTLKDQPKVVNHLGVQ